MKEESRLRLAARFYWEFFKIGCFTFGGGWSIVAQMQKKFVEEEHLIENGDLLDMTSIGKSLPGLMVAHACYLFGYHVGGVPCGFACVLGFVTPPALILTVLAYIYVAVRDNVWVGRAMAGIRGAVVPIVASTVLSMQKSAYPYRICVLVTAGALALYLFTDVSCAVIVLLGAASGLAISRFEQKKEAEKDGAV